MRLMIGPFFFAMGIINFIGAEKRCGVIDIGAEHSTIYTIRDAKAR
jgi:hypothetical protein